jgi:hypothetical protein
LAFAAAFAARFAALSDPATSDDDMDSSDDMAATDDDDGTTDAEPTGDSIEDIQNGTINPEDVNANASLPFEVRGLVVGDWGFRVDSNADAFFLGSPAVRWFNSAGTTQHGSLSVTSSQMVMQHVGQNNAIFRSSSNGVGLAGSFAQPGYAATIPSLLVENSIDIGYERVEVAFALDIAVTSCASHGGQTCWVGTAFATCPAGKSVLGGGTNGSSSAAGNVVRSGPSGNSSWACTMTHNQPGIARICTAICARIQ